MKYWEQFLCLIGYHKFGTEEIIDLMNGETVSYSKCVRCGKYRMEKV